MAMQLTLLKKMKVRTSTERLLSRPLLCNMHLKFSTSIQPTRVIFSLIIYLIFSLYNTSQLIVKTQLRSMILNRTEKTAMTDAIHFLVEQQTVFR